MREYFGESAQKYGQPQDKYFTLFPALDKALPQAEPGQQAIDLGCGTGVLYEMVAAKGYDYTGVDLSADMLTQARANSPRGTFLHSDVTKTLFQVPQKYDLVIANMLFPSIGTKAEFAGVFATAEALLVTKGLFIITAGHPCFDGYMQKHFFQRTDIDTDFTGYFASGSNYLVHRALENSTFTFSDYHWTLSDYFETAPKVGLQITAIDECPVVGDPPPTVVEKFSKRGHPIILGSLYKEILYEILDQYDVETQKTLLN